MRVIFWGTPTYALPTLNALVNSGYDLVAVVTQPDRRRGRGKQLIPSPVKLRAIELGLSVFTPEKLRDDYELQKELAELNADISIVVAFGQILPAEVLNQPLLGCWNGHGSLLPRWRGAGPIQWSILSGDKVTGVGIMAMEEGLDTGPVLLQESIEIGLLENANQLGKRLSELTASLVLEALLKIIALTSGQKLKHISQLNVTKQEQLEGKPTYARMLTKPDHIINWNHSAIDIHRKVMGLCPNAVTAWRGKRLKIITTEPLIEVLSKYLSKNVRPLIGRWQVDTNQPGTILGFEPELGIIVSTHDWPLLIRQAQLEGKGVAESRVLIQQLNPTIGETLVNKSI
ncbi:MAG: methionyl-tRNA formyltransferase [Prochlorococcus sp.]